MSSVKFVRWTTSVSPSQWPREMPFQWRILASGARTLVQGNDAGIVHALVANYDESRSLHNLNPMVVRPAGSWNRPCLATVTQRKVGPDVVNRVHHHLAIIFDSGDTSRFGFGPLIGQQLQRMRCQGRYAAVWRVNNERRAVGQLSFLTGEPDRAVVAVVGWTFQCSLASPADRFGCPELGLCFS